MTTGEVFNLDMSDPDNELISAYIGQLWLINAHITLQSSPVCQLTEKSSITVNVVEILCEIPCLYGQFHEVFNLDMSDPDNDVFTWEIRDVEPNTNIFYLDGLYLMNLYMADQITFI
jgi:hypothetical protein